MASEYLMAALAMALLLGSVGVSGTVFTVVNSCSEMIWAGVLTANNGSSLNGGGFALTPGQSTTVNAPAGWTGRFWGRTGCTFDASGDGSCATGDCGRGLMCNGAGAVPPATLAEFALGDTDYYDVSLVDGYNVPLSITTVNGTGACAKSECIADLLKSCPTELRVTGSDGRVIACKTACEAFGTPEYCCTGDHATPQTCSPNQYSRFFKAGCPMAYVGYFNDDSTSTFTCTHPDYTITFCA